MSAKRVLLVDDHPLLREAMVEVAGDEGLEVCGQASSVQEALALLDRVHCDLVIVDLSLPDGSGLELIKQLAGRRARPRVLVLSMHDETLFAERALHAGADGYVSKQEAVDRIAEAVRTVLAGRRYLSPAMADRLVQLAGRRTPGADPYAVLSDRELEVFELLGLGHPTREVASRLGVSVKTIDSHRANIKRKLGLANAAELMRHAVAFALGRR